MKRISIIVLVFFFWLGFSIQGSLAEARENHEWSGAARPHAGMSMMIHQMHHECLGAMAMLPLPVLPMGKHLQALGLDEKQTGAIKAIETVTMKEMVRKRADEQIAEIDLRDLLDKDPMDIEAVEKKLRQLETIRTDMQILLLRSKEEVKEQLTPEQKNKFKGLAEKMAPPKPPRMMKKAMREDARLPPPFDMESGWCEDDMDFLYDLFDETHCE